MPERGFNNVRSRPIVLDKLLGISPHAGTAIYPNIYVGDAVHQNIVSDTPDPLNLALIAHEQTHIRRIRAAGALRWYAQYLTSPSFRLSEELEATRIQFGYLKATGLDPNLEHRAKILSSAVYLWSTTYSDAFAQLETAWNEATSQIPHTPNSDLESGIYS